MSHLTSSHNATSMSHGTLKKTQKPSMRSKRAALARQVCKYRTHLANVYIFRRSCTRFLRVKIKHETNDISTRRASSCSSLHAWGATKTQVAFSGLNDSISLSLFTKLCALSIVQVSKLKISPKLRQLSMQVKCAFCMGFVSQFVHRTRMASTYTVAHIFPSFCEKIFAHITQAYNFVPHRLSDVCTYA